MSITYYEYASVALIIQRAKCMRRMILSSVICLAVTCFTKLYRKQYDFRRENVIGPKIYILIFLYNF
jgi:hypothetical protein